MSSTCPYSGEIVQDSDFTDEHIFPHAIGGGLDYSIRVSKVANSDLGTRLDAKLISSPMIQGLRLLHGIRSRNGEPIWEASAIHIPSGRPATIKFRADESEVNIKEPIKQSSDGNVEVFCSPEQEERILKAFLAGQAKKGRLVDFVGETSFAGEYRIEAQIDTGLLTRAMLKIAVAAAFEHLGGAVLGDAIILECRKAMFSEDRGTIKRLAIPGFAFEPPDCAAFLPSIADYEHMVVVANIQLSGLVVGVQLFGGGFHSLFMILSEESRKLLDVSQGMIAICDARSRQTRRIDFYQHQLRVCGVD